MSIKTLVHWLAGSALLLGVATAAPAWSAGAETTAIAWQDWDLAAFQLAKNANKMILIDVGMEGCTACRSMDEVTYHDADVVRLVNQHFIAIQVDAEARPDIGERYSDWAWPATIFLTPDATQVLAVRGNRLPKSFVPLLTGLLEKQQSGELSADKLAPYAAAPAPATTPLTTLRDQLRERLDRVLDRDGAGSTSGPRLQQAFLRAHMNDDAALRQKALDAADGYLKMMDRVWGGVFVAATPDGRQIPEKRVSNQANALNVFAEAWQVTNDATFKRAIADVHRYLTGQLQSPNGGFYTSQEDQPAALPKGVDKRAYWAMDDAKRRAIGLPVTDHAVYTDKSGEVILALARAYEATGEQPLLATAAASAKALLAARLTNDGWMLQSAASDKVETDQRMRPHVVEDRPFLSAQVWFGSSLLAMYRVTGDASWLTAARRIGDATLARLWDDKAGGFFATVPDATAAIVAPRKPLEVNGRAAHFFYDLWVYTKSDRYEPIATRTIQGAATAEAVKREGKVTGELALALEKVTNAYVEYSVVGDPKDARAQALFAASRSAYHPRKLLHFEAPGRYPKRARPALYICNPDVCTVPIEDPAKVVEHSLRMRDGARTL